MTTLRIIHEVSNLRSDTFVDAGLTAEEREIVTEAYDQGIIQVIVATCSLAAGINLPARRVILHGARMGRDLIGPAMLYVLSVTNPCTTKLNMTETPDARPRRP